MDMNRISIQDVLLKFEEDSKFDEDDEECWSKLPLTDEQKHEFLMEQSEDPQVQKLCAEIKRIRFRIELLEKIRGFSSCQALRPVETQSRTDELGQRPECHSAKQQTPAPEPVPPPQESRHPQTF